MIYGFLNRASAVRVRPAPLFFHLTFSEGWRGARFHMSITMHTSIEKRREPSRLYPSSHPLTILEVEGFSKSSGWLITHIVKMRLRKDLRDIAGRSSIARCRDRYRSVELAVIYGCVLIYVQTQ